MSAIKISLILTALLLLQACAKHLIVTEIKSSTDGLVTQSIRIDTGKEILLLICYTEISNQHIQGISCQNDTGFHLFSGGLKNNKFELEKVSSFVLQVKPATVLNYIRLALFDTYQINEKYIIEVNKTTDKTTIKDFQKHHNIEIVLL